MSDRLEIIKDRVERASQIDLVYYIGSTDSDSGKIISGDGDIQYLVQEVDILRQRVAELEKREELMKQDISYLLGRIATLKLRVAELEAELASWKARWDKDVGFLLGQPTEAKDEHNT